MKLLRSIILFIISAMLIAPSFSALSDPEINESYFSVSYPSSPTLSSPDQPVTVEENISPAASDQTDDTKPEETPLNTYTPTPTPTTIVTPDPIPDLYGCEMQLNFVDGPFESQSVDFTVLGRDYFEDKGDKFAVGKGTSIYYEEQNYLILHSSYVNGNILKPMEAEFIRRYLENWGNTGEQTIQENINQLIGSEATWTCNGDSTFTTTVSGGVRLSHTASQRLWLEPQELEDILNDQEGLASEWVGGIEDTDEPTILVGFCGWGPKSLENGRYTYFRYLIQFKLDTSSTN